jgi:hypothetical protein
MIHHRHRVAAERHKLLVYYHESARAFLHYPPLDGWEKTLPKCLQWSPLFVPVDAPKHIQKLHHQFVVPDVVILYWPAQQSRLDRVGFEAHMESRTNLAWEFAYHSYAATISMTRLSVEEEYLRFTMSELRKMFNAPGHCRICGIDTVTSYTDPENPDRQVVIQSACAWYCDVHCPYANWPHNHDWNPDSDEVIIRADI